MAVVENDPLVAEISSRLKERVNLPDAVWGFVIDQARTYTITVTGGVPSVAAVTFLPPGRAVTVRLSGATLEALMAGRLEPMVAYFTRRVSIDGPLDQARRLGDLFKESA